MKRASVRVLDVVCPILPVATLTHDGAPVWGDYDPTTQIIRIVKAGAQREAWTLRHEMAHACFELTNMALEMNHKLGSEAADEVEEAIILRVLPAWLASLETAGMIKVLK